MNPTLSIYLDAVRLAAAFLVLVGHSFNFTGGYFHAIAGHGPASVAVFFVLSGFVIAFVTDEKEKTGKAYAISRAARMYSVALPAVLITVVADFIGQKFDLTPYSGYSLASEGVLNTSYFHPDWSWLDITRMLTFTNELWQDHIQVGSGEPYWSLGFEVWYYIIFGAFMFAPFKKSGRILTSVIFALIAGPKIVLYLPLWLIGVWCYKLLKHDAGTSTSTSSWTSAWQLMGFFGAPILYLLARHYISAHTQSMFLPVGWNAKTLITVIYFHLIGIFFCIHLICFNGLAKKFAQIREFACRHKRTVQWLAGATFTLYLVHQPILLAILACNPMHKGSALWAYSSVAMTLLLVFTIAQFTERQKTAWKHLFQRLVSVRGSNNLSQLP